MNTLKIVALAATAAGLLMATPMNAWAYIDPGSGSMAYQVLLAGMLAVGFVFRKAWSKARRWFEPRDPR